MGSEVNTIKVADTAYMKIDKMLTLIDEIQVDVAKLQHDKRKLKEGFAAAVKALNGDIITVEEGESIRKAMDFL